MNQSKQTIAKTRSRRHLLFELPHRGPARPQRVQTTMLGHSSGYIPVMGIPKSRTGPEVLF